MSPEAQFGRSPGTLAGGGRLADVDSDFTEIFGQSGAQTSDYGGRHLVTCILL